jgi:NitT/TauT family transport system substrate-binding protein
VGPSPSPLGAPNTTYAPATPLDPPVTVRVGSLRNIAESTVAIADARGYFPAGCITLDTTVFSVSADAIPALSNGQIDVMPSSGVSPALFDAVVGGIGIQIVGNGGGVAPGHDWFGIPVRKELLDNGRYRGPADLKGLKVAIPGRYAPVHYMLKVLLNKKVSR